MASIDGMRKLSAPKISRQSSDSPRPSSAGVWLRSFSHYSRKITTNIAVITKLSPSVLKWISEPKMPPMAAPVTQ